MLIAATGALADAARMQGPARSARLGALPYQFGGWSGRDAAPPDAETLRDSRRRQLSEPLVRRRVRHADRSVHRLLRARSSRASASIRRCTACPAPAGNRSTSARTDRRAGRLPRVEARRLIVRKNLDRAIVLYWYAIHGRTLASETRSKAWLLHDSLRFHRSDAALVRIVVPIHGAADAAAQREGLAFAHDVLPYLPHLWS